MTSGIKHLSITRQPHVSSEELCSQNNACEKKNLWFKQKKKHINKCKKKKIERNVGNNKETEPWKSANELSCRGCGAHAEC